MGDSDLELQDQLLELAGEADLSEISISVQERLGGGSSGRVYRCLFKGKAAAIKVVHPNLSRREDTLLVFMKEAHMMHACKHRWGL